MMKQATRRIGGALAFAGVLTLTASPALAQGWGWDRHRHYHRGGSDAGEVLAGLLLIGGIVAIASAASNADERERRVDDRRYYPEGDGYRPDQTPAGGSDNRPEWREGNGIEGAVNRCAGAVSTGSREVESVDTVSREGQGWRIGGKTATGQPFTCSVDASGQISGVSVDGQTVR